MGTLCAFTMPSFELREEFGWNARNMGLEIGGCGNQAVRYLPYTFFIKTSKTPGEARMFLILIHVFSNSQ